MKIKDMVTGDQQALSLPRRWRPSPPPWPTGPRGKPIRERAEAMRKRKVGAVGLLLIAAVVVIAVVFLRPKGLAAVLGDRFSPEG
ncbi:MAG: hypothetical protein ACLR6W_11030 [Evtepia sp.]